MSAMADLDLQLEELLNDLNDARQSYDDATEHPNLVRIMATGDQLATAANELHHFLVMMRS